MKSQFNQILHSGIWNGETETEQLSYYARGTNGVAGAVWEWIVQALCKRMQLSKRVGSRTERSEVEVGRGRET